MPDVPRSHLIAYVLAAIAVLAFGWRQVSHSGATEVPAGVPIEASATPAADGASGGGAGSAGADGAGAGAGGTASGEQLVIHVAGWVRRPGVYRLAKGLRVDDAVKAAGGARRGADLSQLNLAMELEDGRQVLVARRGAAAAPAPPASGAGAAAPSAGLGATPAAAVNLNTATVEQLDTLQGVGPVTAANIIAYRDEHGGFGSIDELGEVTGIGPVRLEALRTQVTL